MTQRNAEPWMSMELVAADAARSAEFYERLLGVRFKRCEYSTLQYEGSLGSQRMVIRQIAGQTRAGGGLRLQIATDSRDPNKLARELALKIDAPVKVENVGVETWRRSTWDRWLVLVSDPDGHEVAFRRRVLSGPQSAREALRELPALLAISARWLWDRLVDRIEYQLNWCPVKQQDVSAYTHLMASREGLYAIHRSGYQKILRGQFYGLSVHQGHIYVFQANGPLRSPRKRGRIVRLPIERQGGKIRIGQATVVTRGLDNGCHQMDFVGDQLYILDTYHDRVVRLDAQFRIDAVLDPLAAQENLQQSAGAHMNSLVFHDNSFWLLLHNGPRRANSKVLRLDSSFKLQTTITLDARTAHNIVFLEDGSFLVCDSSGGRLVDRQGLVAPIGAMMLRGLSVDREQVVVGDSYYATRFGRRYVPGHVHFHDRSLQLLATLVVPAAPTELRRIDGLDYSLSNHSRNAPDAVLAEQRHAAEVAQA